MKNIIDQKKILIITNTLDKSCGWGRYSLEIINSLTTHDKLSLTILTCESTGYPGERAILRPSNTYKDYLFNIMEIYRAAKSNDIIHCFDAYPYGVWAAVANIWLKRFMVINLVGTYSVDVLDRWPKKYILAWVYKRADAVLSISNYTLREVAKRVFLPKTEVIYLGVDSNKFLPRENKNFRTETKRLLSVGAVKARKGYEVAIQALALVVKEYPRAVYTIVGDQQNKGYLYSLKQRVEELGLHKNVEWLSSITDQQLVELYQAADVFILPSQNQGNSFEGFGAVFLEASSCGIPVIGSKDCGTEDAIVDGKTGFLIDQGRLELLAQKIIFLFNNPDLSGEMGQAGRRFAEEMTWERVSAKIVSVYNQVSP